MSKPRGGARMGKLKNKHPQTQVTGTPTAQSAGCCRGRCTELQHKHELQKPLSVNWEVWVNECVTKGF